MEDKTVERDPSPAEPAQTASHYSWQRGPIELPHVALGFHTPGLLTKDAFTFEVLASIMGQGRASRLIQYERDEKELITSGSAQLHGFQDLGFFEIDFESNKPVQAQIAVLAELEDIKRFGVTAEALARAKALI